MEVSDVQRLLSEALAERDARARSAVKELADARKDYLDFVQVARGMMRLVKNGTLSIFPEPFDLSQVDGWEDLAVTLGEPKSDLERIQRILPPRNEPFTVGDLKRRFSEMYPGYELRDAVWQPYLQRLRADGDVVRVERSCGGKPGLYAVAGSTIALDEDAKAQPDLAIDVLRETGKPMTVTEIVSELRDRGIGLDATAKTMETNLTRGLKRRPEFVELRGKKWWRLIPPKEEKGRIK